MKQVDAEIERLSNYQKLLKENEVKRMEIEAKRSLVPESPALERLLRYEASLERSFDRTLSQLERLQRMRRGQPVPPTVKLELS